MTVFESNFLIGIVNAFAIHNSRKCDISACFILKENEPRHEISNNVVCATSKASDQPAHVRSLIRAFASRLTIH